MRKDGRGGPVCFLYMEEAGHNGVWHGTGWKAWRGSQEMAQWLLREYLPGRVWPLVASRWNPADSEEPAGLEEAIPAAKERLGDARRDLEILQRVGRRLAQATGQSEELQCWANIEEACRLLNEQWKHGRTVGFALSVFREESAFRRHLVERGELVIGDETYERLYDSAKAAMLRYAGKAADAAR